VGMQHGENIGAGELDHWSRQVAGDEEPRGPRDDCFVRLTCHCQLLSDSTPGRRCFDLSQGRAPPKGSNLFSKLILNGGIQSVAKWITFSRPAYGGFFRFTCLDFERIPRSFCGNARAATQEEIDMEIKTRSGKALVNSARPEWKDVEMLRRALNAADSDGALLDRLTPDEWRSFRLKLIGD